MVVAVAAGVFLVRPPAEVPTDTTGPGPQPELVDETVPPPPSALEPGPRPDVPGKWVVYATGTRYCCDERGRSWDPPVREVTCVPVDQLDAGVPEAKLAFWRVPLAPDAVDVEQDAPCPMP